MSGELQLFSLDCFKCLTGPWKDHAPVGPKWHGAAVGNKLPEQGKLREGGRGAAATPPHPGLLLMPIYRRSTTVVMP